MTLLEMARLNWPIRGPQLAFCRKRLPFSVARVFHSSGRRQRLEPWWVWSLGVWHDVVAASDGSSG